MRILLRHFNLLHSKRTNLYRDLSVLTAIWFRNTRDVTCSRRGLVTKTEKNNLPDRPDVYQRVMAKFPPGIQMAFAYGSGVFEQTGQDKSKNMLDFILVVDEPVLWHQENLKLNKSHYSFLARLGPQYISKIQENYGAGIYFNTLVPFEERLIKYGVISKSRLVKDLLEWNTLYVSGRLHKPVKLIMLPKCEELKEAMRYNLLSAIHSALLLLPETFKEEDLFKQIASLSYSGDFRMTFGEDKGKVQKIVMPNIPYFYHLYADFLNSRQYIHWDRNSGVIEQYPSHISQFHHLNLLPKAVQHGLLVQMTVPGKSPPDLEEVIWTLAHDWDCGEYVAKSIANIVQRSSWNQSVKGILTAGIRKTVSYSCSKVKKMLKGMRLKGS